MRVGKKRFEVGSFGIDEALQGLSSDPFASSLPGTTGLRIPAFVNTPTTRYRFNLASYVARSPTRLVGLRQGLWLMVPGVATSTAPVELLVRDNPRFAFPDGNVSWHLVREPNQRNVTTRPSSDAANFMFTESDGPALLYKSATFAGGAFDPVTGAPQFYDVGMTSYVPPDIPSQWEGLLGLGNFQDIRFPMDSHNAWQSLGWPGCIIESGERVSLQATVLQTDPGGRLPFQPPGNEEFALAGTPREVAFVLANTGEEPGAIFGRIFGSIIFEEVMPDEYFDTEERRS